MERTPTRRTVWWSIFRRQGKGSVPYKARPFNLGVHSVKPLPDIVSEVRRVLDALGVLTRSREVGSGFEGHYSTIDASTSCHFTVGIGRSQKSEGVQQSFVEFKYDKGDCDLYNDMCSVIQRDIKL